MRLAALAVVICATRIAAAQPQALKPGQYTPAPSGEEVPQVDVLTFGVGDEIFEKYGHAAICLRYVKRPPVCFNYGVTDFDAGTGLIWNFLRGRQRFWVEPSAYETLLSFYRAEDRDIYRQTLTLPEPQRRAIEQALWENVRGDNRYYDYDHFFANCSTRVRDVIDRATGGRLHPANDTRLPVTFRQIGHRGLAELPALVVLTDFLIGRQADDRPTHWEAMFSPEELRAELTQLLQAPPEHIHIRQGPPFPTSGSSGRMPVFALGLLFALPLLLARWRANGERGLSLGVLHVAFAVLLAYVLYAISSLGAGAIVVFGAVLATPMVLAHVTQRGEQLALAWVVFYLGLWGILIWGLAALSHIPGIRWNEAVLVVTPLDLALLFVGEELRRRYAVARVSGLALVSALCAIGVFHQPLWIPILTVFVPMAIIAFDPPFGLLPAKQPRDTDEDTTLVTKKKVAS